MQVSKFVTGVGEMQITACICKRENGPPTNIGCVMEMSRVAGTRTLGPVCCEEISRFRERGLLRQSDDKKGAKDS
jgi:hypothetical protein